MKHTGGTQSTTFLALFPSSSTNSPSPLLPREKTMDDVKFMGEAAMAIIRGKTKKIDVLKIEAQPKQPQEE